MFLNDWQAGKTNVKSIFKFKGREENISTLMMKKEKYDKNIAKFSSSYSNSYF